jgi:hypothetical protein
MNLILLSLRSLLQFIRHGWRVMAEVRTAKWIIVDVLGFSIGLTGLIGFSGEHSVAVLAMVFLIALALSVVVVGYRNSKPEEIIPEMVPLSDAAARLYGEVQGTWLAKMVEELANGLSERILDHMGTQIARDVSLHVKRPPSSVWEILPETELNKVQICNGATGIRYFGRDQITYTDLQVTRNDLDRVIAETKKIANGATGSMAGA